MTVNHCKVGAQRSRNTFSIKTMCKTLWKVGSPVWCRPHTAEGVDHSLCEAVRETGEQGRESG
jgi:hypothetical protein